MTAVKLGTPGFRCVDCCAIFTEDAAGTCREVAVSEAYGARQVSDETWYSCPSCGYEDLDDIELCYRCEEHESCDAGLCAVCAPPVLEPDFPQADLDSLAEGNFRRDKGAAA